MDAQMDIFGGEAEVAPVRTAPVVAAPARRRDEQLALIQATPLARGQRTGRELYTEPELF